MTIDATASRAAPRAGAREWAGLAVLALPTLLLALDNSVLFLALPHLGADLRPSSTQLLWIMDAYGFMTAGFLIIMGSLGDRIGRRRLLLIGAAAFGAASVLAAYASSAALLIAARALLGVAGATMMPSALALISTMFADARQRAAAIGVFTGCFMGGAALGPVIGGVLLERFWWGSVFLLGVPVMVLLLATAPLLLPEQRDAAQARLDPASVALSLAAILPIVYGLKEAAADAAQVAPYALILVGAAFGVALARRQNRLDDPMLDLRLFRGRTFTAALLILLLTMVVQGGVYLLVSQHLQLVEGMSPLRAGLWLVPPALALVAGSLAAPILARRVRPGTVVGGGLALAAAGFLTAALADGLGLLVAGIVVGFLGTAPVGALGMGLIVDSVRAEKAGTAAAMAQTGGEFGIAFGVAAMGSIGTAVYRHSIDVPEGTPPDAARAAGDSMHEAAPAAEGLPGPLAADLLRTAHDAFADSLATVVGVGTVLVAVLAALSAALLRHLRPIGQPEEATVDGSAGKAMQDR